MIGFIGLCIRVFDLRPRFLANNTRPNRHSLQGTKLTAVPQKSTTGAKKKTAKSRATKSKMIKRSVPNMKRAKTKKKSSRKPDENSEPTTIDADEVPSKSRGECSLVTNLLEAEYSEQKSKLATFFSSLLLATRYHCVENEMSSSKSFLTL